MKGLEALSRHLSSKIKESDPEGPVSLEILEYELGIRLNFIATLLMTVLAGWITGNLWEACLAMVSFLVVRRFSGGVHMKSLTLCALVSASIFVSIPFIVLDPEQIRLFTLISAAVFLIYSPNILEELNPPPLTPYMKAISVALVLSNYIFQSSAIALACAVQAFLILPFWKGGESR
ncbi:accessory gene regulator B family protein [Paenibacillus sp. YPG26]|uniref:accessory gene regulator ArgB-like protein n=1 Tax=Paenibacillus sp. YPG26 TaxID=2878915 RepID=UPI00203AC7CF|nr:accessory gene regulator B family protein [Paenibacillus sp. YPG26]USB32152.1 accessory gene regulator B family protein [Paenibacillus sp. YPG26]